MDFEEINPDDFSNFKPGYVFPHVKIEQLLTVVGGGSTAGTAYKSEVLKLAGWKHDSLIGYAKHPEVAAEAFNKLRDIIAKTQDKEEILAILSGAG